MQRIHRRWRSSAIMQERARQLRREPTPAEGRLWQHLRGAQLAAYEFRRQYPMGRFIVDFYCPQAKLVIEVDGDTHADQTAYDVERSRWIDEQKRCTVIRFTNSDVHENLADVLDTIATVLRTQVA
jgi:very-short-patch-repair endonuclease